MPSVILGIGSNISPRKNVPAAVRKLLDAFGDLHLSDVVETEPVGIPSSAMFLNALAWLHTTQQGAQLKSTLNAIEESMGRDRSAPDRSQRDRVIDLDVLWEGAAADDMPPVHLTAADTPYLAQPYARLLASLRGDALPSLALPGVALSVFDQAFGLAPTELHNG